VIFLVFDDDVLTFSASEIICMDFICDSMRETFSTMIQLLQLIFVIIRVIDPPLYRFLMLCKSEPVFTVSWFLTWFSHDITILNDAARVFDVLLCSHPSFIIYLCSSVS
jgi:hypothetical protein